MSNPLITATDVKAECIGCQFKIDGWIKWNDTLNGNLKCPKCNNKLWDIIERSREYEKPA